MSDLTQATRDKIDAAIQGRDLATSADQEHARRVQEMTAAQAAEEAAKDASLTAHQLALSEAHDAIDALTAELSSEPAPQPGPENPPQAQAARTKAKARHR